MLEPSTKVGLFCIDKNRVIMFFRIFIDFFFKNHKNHQYNKMNGSKDTLTQVRVY
jgi:hypothetical protein